MRLVRLVYASSLESGVDSSELNKIVNKSQVSNAQSSITGMLLFGNDKFLQCLEGGREAVNRLYAKIANDPRHTHISILHYEEVVTREFAEWSMKAVLLTQARREQLLKFSLKDDFDPYTMSGESAVQLLIDVSR